MARVPLHRVITEVLQRAGRPLSPREIYEYIERENLYEFRSQNPAGIVRNQLRRHCIDIRHSCSSRTEYFTMNADGRFTTLPQSIELADESRHVVRETTDRLRDT